MNVKVKRFVQNPSPRQADQRQKIMGGINSSKYYLNSHSRRNESNKIPKSTKVFEALDDEIPPTAG